MGWGIAGLEILLLHGLLWAVIPQSFADRCVRAVRAWITTLSLTQAWLALALVVMFLVQGLPVLEVPYWLVPVKLDAVASVTTGWLYDGASGLMLCLVSFMAWVICRYSVRYLDGDPHQGNFYRWLAVASSGVSVMALSDSLAVFGLAWLLVSFAVHRLLLHFSDRPLAQRAAWSKFFVSRLGDASLLAAIILLHSQLGTLRFPAIMAGWEQAVSIKPFLLHSVPLLLAFTALTRSVQFPFHTWMPLSLDTPTPVSAFMHAGIINAGGYLLIRVSPILNDSPWALGLLVTVGAWTAIYGAIVMQTQPSVKSALAYSTIAQMGFMILQCGLGAYSAAMLHILAHSCYKAYAFLASGSVLQERARQRGANPDSNQPVWLAWCTSTLLAMLIVAASFAIARIDVASKPAGILLGGLMTLALASWLLRVLTSEKRWLPSCIAAAFGMCLLYSLSFQAIDGCLNAARSVTANSTLMHIVTGLVLTMIWIAIPVSRNLIQASGSGHWLAALRVHAANGFYLTSILQRCFGNLRST